MTTALEQETEIYEEVARDAGIDPEAFEGFCRNQHIKPEDCEDAVTNFFEAYIDHFSSHEYFVREYMQEKGDWSVLPTYLQNHIDWDEVWECELRHEFYEINGYYFASI